MISNPFGYLITSCSLQRRSRENFHVNKIKQMRIKRKIFMQVTVCGSMRKNYKNFYVQYSHSCLLENALFGEFRFIYHNIKNTFLFKFCFWLFVRFYACAITSFL